VKRCLYLLVALISLCLLCTQASASATSLSTQQKESQPNYAGYSWHPGKGFVDYAAALWKVPKIDCAKAPTGNDGRHARAAVWVGLWGGPNTRAGIKASWLPQVGTVSFCQISKNFTPGYVAFAEIAHDGVCNVPGDNKCKEQTLSLSVHPGDQVDGDVEYSGVGTGVHAGEYEFDYFIYDINTGDQSSGLLYTASAVLRSAVAYQGGAIVEDQDGNGNPLAEFPAPITFTKVSVGNSSGELVKPTTYLWNMVVSGKQLAKTGVFKNDKFTVTWQRWG
jgi:hypothetical protein